MLAPTTGWKLTNHHKTCLAVQCDILCNCCSSVPVTVVAYLFTARCYASVVYALVMCLSVCHIPVMYQNVGSLKNAIR